MKGSSVFFICVFALSTLGTTGCFGARQIQINEGYEGYVELHPELAEVKPSSGSESIAIELVAPENAGCVMLRLDDGEEKESRGDFRCAMIPVTTDDEKDDLKAAYKAMDEAEGDPQKMGFVMAGYGATLQGALERQLGGHFGEVRVQRKDEASGGAGGVEHEGTFHFDRWRTATKRMLVTLTATPTDGGAPIAVTGEVDAEMGNGHLAWMIPLGVLTFPIGYGIGLAVFDSMEADFIARIIAQAMDDAAGKLAAELAAQPAAAPAAEPAAEPAADPAAETARYRVVPTISFL